MQFTPITSSSQQRGGHLGVVSQGDNVLRISSYISVYYDTIVNAVSAAPHSVHNQIPHKTSKRGFENIQVIARTLSAKPQAFRSKRKEKLKEKK